MPNLRKSTLFCSALALIASSAFAKDQSRDITTMVNLGTPSEIYQRWSGEDKKLTVQEWDRAVDLIFGEDPVNLAVAQWDKDVNGTISQAEFNQAINGHALFDANWASQSLFKVGDTNKDDRLSKKEFEGYANQYLLVFSDWDTNKDNQLTKSELTGAGIDTNFDEWNTDEDEFLDEEETYNGIFSYFDDNEDAHWGVGDWDDAGDAGFLDV